MVLLSFNTDTKYHTFCSALLLRRLVLGVRAYFGRANVSRKTLVDGRFLL